MVVYTTAVFLSRMINFKSLAATGHAAELGQASKGVIAVTGCLVKGVTRRRPPHDGTPGAYTVISAGGKFHEIYADDGLANGTTVLLMLIMRVKSGWAGRMKEGNSGFWKRGLVLAPYKDPEGVAEGLTGYRCVGNFKTSGERWSKNVFDGSEQEQVVNIY